MSATGSTSPWYGGFRIAVFALLAGNAAYYLYSGMLSKGLDAAAWLLLLTLYALETGFSRRIRAPRAASAVRVLRLVAAAGVCVAGVAYLLERNSLDAINTGLWIAVVVLLELEVRRPRYVAQYRTWFKVAAAMLYSGLAVLVLAWGWRREWFDAYDALLWLIAFATIEIDVLRTTRGNVAV